MMILAESGLETDAVLKDKDTFAAVVAGTTNEVVNAGYSRKVLTDADLSAYTVDDSLDRTLLTLPLQTFATISAGDSWRKGVVGYDADTGSGTDSDIIPITAFDILLNGVAVVPNGDNIVIDLSSGWLYAR